MNENIRLNGMESICEARVLNWGENIDDFNPPYEVIILSDVVCIMFLKKKNHFIHYYSKQKLN